MTLTSNGQRSDGSVRTYSEAPYCSSGWWTPMNTNEYYERTPTASSGRLSSEYVATQRGTPAPSGESPSDAESSYSAFIDKTRIGRGGRVAVDREIQRVAMHMEETRQICWTAQKLARDANPELLAKALTARGREAKGLTNRANSLLDAGNQFLNCASNFPRVQQEYHDSVLRMRTHKELLEARSKTNDYNTAHALFLDNFARVKELVTEYAEECDHRLQPALENMSTPTAPSTPPVYENENTKEGVEELRQRLQRMLGSVAEGGYVYNTPVRRESEFAPSQQSGCGAVSFGYTTTITQSSQARSVMVA